MKQTNDYKNEKQENNPLRDQTNEKNYYYSNIFRRTWSTYCTTVVPLIIAANLNVFRLLNQKNLIPIQKMNFNRVFLSAVIIQSILN